MTSRRRFLTLVPLAGTAALVRAQTPAAVDPKDPNAVALGFTLDATKVDKSKFPSYAPGQACGNCALYQAPPDKTVGACPIYQNKLVPAKGWCKAWVKKTA
ncbi:MAG TPA: high-potential iron-sulfur protein [Burkholderiaceae bacterium]